MGMLSDRRALRQYRNGEITFNALAEALGFPRFEEIIASPLTAATISTGHASGAHVEMNASGMTAYDDSGNVNAASPLTFTNPDWREDWPTTHDDVPLFEVLWGANCSHLRQAAHTAQRVIDRGWANDWYDASVLTGVLRNHDLRSKSAAIAMADLIERLGWTRPEPEPAESIMCDGYNVEQVSDWLGREVERGAFILTPEETVTGRATGVWPGSILHRVGHLVEVLTADAPESTVSHEPANAEEPDIYDAVAEFRGREEKGSPDREPEGGGKIEGADFGPQTVVINLPKFDEDAIRRAVRPLLDFNLGISEALAGVKAPKMPRTRGSAR